MEAAFNAVGISVGKLGDGWRVTPAVLRYCEKLVAYLTNIPTTTLLSGLSYSPLGQALAAQLSVAEANISSTLQDAIVQIIKQEVEYDEDKFSTFGLGRQHGLLTALFSNEVLRAFASSLTYAVYSCVDMDYNESRFTEYSDTDFVVRAIAEVLRIPNDQELIDGMLVSEAVLVWSEPLSYCLCLDGVPLWPDSDARVEFSPDDQANEGTFRLKAARELERAYIRGTSYEAQGYLVFVSPSFLQGIQSMDRILQAPTPSYKDLEIFQNGAWRPARAD